MAPIEHIQSLHLEISSRCNAACPDCLRNLRGMDIDQFKAFEQREFSLTQIQQIFAPEFIKNLRLLLINGNLGDFVTCRDALPITRYFREHNQSLLIRISTNGSGQPHIWSDLGALENIEVEFALDGLADLHDRYRQYTNFDQIIANARSFIKGGGRAYWKMIEFDFNIHQRARARDMARELGFTHFFTVNHGRNNMTAFDRKGRYRHTIGRPDPEIRDSQQMLDLFSQQMARRNHDDLYRNTESKAIRCKVQGKQSHITQIYVQSDGQVYPCCWLGRAPDTMHCLPGSDQITKIHGNNNALEVGLAQAIEWFANVQDSWKIPQVSQGRLYVCNETCGIKPMVFL